MIKEKFNNNVLGLKYFYNLFAKSKRYFPTFYFMFPIKTRKKKLLVEWNLYRKIIETYLDIYFNEFYYFKSPKYFLLSGNLMKVKSKSFFKNKTGNHQGRNVIWIWYNRPSFAYFSNIRILKLKGSSSKVGRLDRNYKIDNDVELLESYHSALQKMKEPNKFFKND